MENRVIGSAVRTALTAPSVVKVQQHEAPPPPPVVPFQSHREEDIETKKKSRWWQGNSFGKHAGSKAKPLSHEAKKRKAKLQAAGRKAARKRK